MARKKRRTTRSLKKNQGNERGKSLSTKERLFAKRKAKEARKKVITIGLSSLMLGAILALPLFFVAGIKVAIVALMIIPCLVLSYVYPRQALWFFLIYMPFTGTVTYWIGGGNALFQLSKDIFYLPALIALIQDCRKQRKPILVNKKLILTFGILVTCTFLTLFLVNGTQQTILPFCDSLSPEELFLRAPDGSYILDPETNLVIATPCKKGIPFLQGLLGLKVFIGYVPLIFVGYYLIETKEQLIFLGRLFLVLAIICCSLGLLQYLMLATGICQGTRGALGGDLFRASLQAKCLVGGSLLYSPSQGQIRLPGTFVSPWHWAWFLIANSFITFTVAFIDKSVVWRTAGLGGLVLILMNAVISGQRLALALVPFCILLCLILTGQIVNLKRFIPFGIGLVLILSVVATANPQIIQQRVDSFVSRWNTAPPHLFIQEQFAYATRQQKGILGRGLGKATNSARVFGPTALVETYHPKLLYEVGYVGLFAFLLFTTNLVFVTRGSYRQVKDPTINSFGSIFWVFILLLTYFPYWYPLDTDPVTVYYWLFAGVLLKLPSLDKQQKNDVNLEKDSIRPKSRSRQAKLRKNRRLRQRRA